MEKANGLLTKDEFVEFMNEFGKGIDDRFERLEGCVGTLTKDVADLKTGIGTLTNEVHDVAKHVQREYSVLNTQRMRLNEYERRLLTVEEKTN